MNEYVEIWKEGLEAVGSAVAGKIESIAGESMLGQEDRGGLEGPADVVAIPMNHKHQSLWWIWIIIIRKP